MKVRSFISSSTHFFAIFCFIGIVSADEICRSGWSYYKGSCYKSTGEKNTYSGTRRRCHQDDAEVVTPRSADEQEYAFGMSYRVRTWVGVQRYDEYFFFLWDDGTSLTTMEVQLPSEQDGQKLCVLYEKSKLTSASCEALHQYVCKYPKFDELSCKEKWVEFQGNCYYYDSTARNRNDAKQFCNKFQAHLTTVHTEKEARFLNGLTKGSAVSTGLLAQNYRRKTWYSSDGTKISYLRWSAGEPNSLIINGGDNEKCVEMTFEPKYNDITCYRLCAVVCQYKRHTCKKGWDEVGRSCYKVIHEAMKYEDARTVCEKEGGILASFETEHEFESISKLLPSRYYWIGVQKVENNWIWLGATTPFKLEVQNPLNVTGTNAVFDRNEKKIYEMDKWKNNAKKQYRRFPAICKYYVLTGKKRPCRSVAVPANDACYPETENRHRYQVKQKKCPLFPDLEKHYWQPPKYVEMDDGDKQYCIYDLKVSNELFGDAVEGNNETNFTSAEHFCIHRMHGRLIYPENQNEMKLLHQILIEPDDQLPQHIGISVDIEKLHYYSDSNITKSVGNKHQFVVSFQQKSEICHPSWVLVGESCLRFYDDPMNYDSASKFCETMKNTRLATFPTTQEFQKAWSLYEKKVDSYWIGLTKDGNQWKWNDGQNLSTSMLLPEDKDASTEGCAVAYQDKKILHSSCSEQFSYVCEYKSNIRVSKNNLIDRVLCKVYHSPSESKSEIRENVVAKELEAENSENSFCPLHWFQFEDSCFRYYPEALSWEEAGKQCEARKGMLAVFKTAHQYSAVASSIGEGPFWFGLRRKRVGWQWTNRDALLFEINITTSGDVSEYQECIFGSSINASNESLHSWNTNWCSEPMPYMCILQPKNSCEQGFVEYQNNCYLYVSTVQSLEEAEKTCHMNRANIVWIDSQKEQEFLNGYADRPFWIGLKPKRNRLQWINSRKVIYKQWSDEETKVRNKVMYTISTWRGWFVKQEIDKAPVICKYEKGRKRLLHSMFPESEKKEDDRKIYFQEVNNVDEISKIATNKLYQREKKTKDSLWTILAVIVGALGFFTTFICCVGVAVHCMDRKPEP